MIAPSIAPPSSPAGTGTNFATLTKEQIIAAREARNVKINATVAQLVASASAVLRSFPKQATPFVPADDDTTTSETGCWVVRAIDLKGRPRTGFLRGPFDIALAYQHANSAFRNWTIVKLEPTNETEPPAAAHPRGLDPDSHQFGVLSRLHSLRRR